MPTHPGNQDASSDRAEGDRLDLDELTLERARRGHEEACRALFRCYQRRVFSYLWRMLGHHATLQNVEDLAQETFLRVFRALPTFRAGGPAKLSTWIFTIGHRLALNELRNAKSRTPLAVPSGSARALAGADDRALRAELGRRIQDALDKLSDEHRAVFLLREYHGLPTEEVSRILNIPAGTIKSRLSRARAALREAMESEDE